ncbi:hypothetical protein K505DRAFT_90436 [Melanomma pulvis-pyrius CBS 109.77]|uniref:Uncharacterized protein n=1 Tax=Melanomma pulvis-pyrius CBS 109.77 TaxID=1314802 RepID=A0A6A6X038_9PLEO|nr:hypothetical protein K505DRAFT_90436 [Melanomma pulvis-pyrius CBS 109.77]
MASQSLSLPSLFIFLSTTILTSTTTFAHPLPPTTLSETTTSTPHTLSKRSPDSHKIGINLCITLSIIICAALFFFLGMRRGRSQSWFCLPKTFSWPWTWNPRTWTWRWPWRQYPAPVFELEDTERKRRSRRSWLWERMRAEESGTIHNSPVEVSPIARSRDQIREARREECARREGHAGAGRDGRPATAQHLDVDLNVYEMGSNASHRSPSPHPPLPPLPPPPPSPTKPQNWFLHWRFYFEQGQAQPQQQQGADRKTWATEKQSMPRRWFSVKSNVSRSNSKRYHEVNYSRWSKSTTYSVYELDGASATPPPAYPEKAHVWGRLGEKESGLDWSGLEFMKKMYEKRVSVWRAA